MKMGMWMHLLFVSMLAVFIALLIVPSDNVKGSGDPVNMGGHYETSGDWTVDGLSGMYVYMSTTIVVNGNLTVTAPLTLTLINVTLVMNVTDYSGQYNITVQSGAGMNIQTGSNITGGNTDGDHRYGFVVEGGASFTMTDSELHECGWNLLEPDYRDGGLNIQTSGATITGNDFSDNYAGVILYGTSATGATISGNAFHDNPSATAVLITNGASSNIVTNNIFYDNLNGVFVSGVATTNVDIMQNKIQRSSNAGIIINGSTGIDIIQNVLEENSFYGIFGDSTTSLLVDGNFVNDTWDGTPFPNEEGRGIQVDNCVGTVISNNHANYNAFAGIAAFGSLGNTTFINNFIGNTTHFALADVLDLTGEGWFENNYIDTAAFGLFIQESQGVRVTNNLIEKCGGLGTWTNAGGINSYMSIDLYYEHNVVRECSGGLTYAINGHYTTEANGVTVEGDTYEFNEYNLHVGDLSSNILVKNSTITNGFETTYDVIVADDAHVTLLNTTFDETHVLVGGTDTSLTAQFYLHVKVVRGGTGEDGVDVYVYNETGAQDPSSGQPFTTSGGGYVNFIPVTWFVEKSDSRNIYTPHDVYAQATDAEGWAAPGPTMDQSRWVLIPLNARPEVVNIIPVASALIDVLRTDTLTIQVNGLDQEDDEADLIPYIQYRVNDTSPWTYGNYLNNATITYIGTPDNGHFEIDFTPSTTAPLDSYDVRAMFQDTYGSFSDWFDAADAINVINNLPVVVNITSTYYALFRGESAYLIADCEDVEDDDDSLGAEIEYRSPTGDWSGPDGTLGVPFFDGSNWRSEFTPQSGPTKAEIGWYDFRAQCTDSDGDSSGWTYFYDLIEVLNNEPVADDLESGKASIFREIEHTWLFANVTELEDPESDLAVEFEYLEPGTGWGTAYFNLSTLQYDAQGFWKIRFEPTTSAVPGMYSFKVTFIDLDGGMDSLVITGLVEVKNNPPLAHNIIPSDTTTYAGAIDPIYLHVNASDVEDLESELDILTGDNDIQWQFNGAAGGDYSSPWMSTWFGSCSYDVDGEFLKVPWMPPDTAQVGYYGFKARVTDIDGDKSSPYLVILNAVYVDTLPPPKMSMAMDIEEVYRTQDVVITVDVSDTIEPENELIPRLEYRIVGTMTWSELPGTPYYTGTAPDGHWEVYWTPEASLEPGTYEFQCRFENSEGEFSEYVEGEVDIAVLNNEPQVQDMVVPSSAYRMETVYIIANGIDSDKLEEDLVPVFKYEPPDGDWMAQGDSSSYFRNAPQYTNGQWHIEFQAPYNAPLGDYTFRVKISDGIDETDWFSAIDDMTLSTNPQDPDGDGLLNDQDTDDDGDGVPDLEDAFPDDPAASVDTDNDGDPDDWNPGKTAADSTLGLFLDIDDDNDDISDDEDAFPQDPAASVDTDSDGKPDSWNRGKDESDSTTGLELDDDVDGDGVPDVDDAFPLDPDEDADTDDDGIGNNADDDDDGDGVLDVKDPDPLDPKITGKPPGPQWYLWVILALVAVVIVVVIIMMRMVRRNKKGK
jgi:parallel beta-helix repeat protein